MTIMIMVLVMILILMILILILITVVCLPCCAEKNWPKNMRNKFYQGVSRIPKTLVDDPQPCPTWRPTSLLYNFGNL